MIRPIKTTGLIRCLTLLICALSFTGVRTSAQSDTASVSTVRRMADGVINLAETVLDALTIERQNVSLALYPAASYSSRAGLAIGIMPLLQVSSPRLPRPATLTPAVLISTKRMFEVQCDADLYLPHNIDITGKFEFYKQPDDLYATGNGKDKSALARYDFQRNYFTAEALKGWGAAGHFRTGLMFEVDDYRFSGIEPSSSADSVLTFSLTSSGCGTSVGGGLVVGYDGRDNVLSPSRGLYALVSVSEFGRSGGFGSFGTVTADVRHYWALPMKSVIAAQVYGSVGWGDMPFTKMPTCGGTRLGRAIGHNLKYVDSGAWLAQAEWRVPLFWRVGAVAFGGVGNVASRLGDAFTDVHLMCGAGLRLAVFPGKGLNLRLDGGISSRGDHAIYFNVREAF